MSQLINNLTETLSDDLYEKTRAQLNAFLNETNALLATGDVLHEDRTALARERLAEFLKGAQLSALQIGGPPPVTRALNQVKSHVASHPWVAVGAAASLGLLVSWWLNRKHY